MLMLYNIYNIYNIYNVYNVYNIYNIHNIHNICNIYNICCSLEMVHMLPQEKTTDRTVFFFINLFSIFLASNLEPDSPSSVIANKLRRLLSEAETSGSESGMESVASVR